MPLVLRDHETRQALTMADAIAAIEDACREQAAGTAVAVERRVMWLPNGWMRLLPGALTGSGVIGYKAFHRTGSSVRYAVHLFDHASGEAIALMDGSYITAVRTGAAAGVAVKHLAPPAAATLGVIGSGAEARTEIEADRKSTRLNSSHIQKSRMPSSA